LDQFRVEFLVLEGEAGATALEGCGGDRVVSQTLTSYLLPATRLAKKVVTGDGTYRYRDVYQKRLEKHYF
jgi:hypothetical protein